MGLLGRSFRKGDGLLVVDVQIDFCPGGALPIAEVIGWSRSSMNGFRPQ
jgi:hypothetical protein